MARINIETKIFGEDRFIELCIKAGGRIPAMGALSLLWIEAQKYYLKFGEIPADEWEKSKLPQYLIDTGWAEHTETGVRAKGQDEQFGWLRQASEAGKASADKRSAQNNPQESNGRQPMRSTPVEPALNGRQPPLSFLSSPSSFLNTQNSFLEVPGNEKITISDGIVFSEEGISVASPPDPDEKASEPRRAKKIDPASRENSSEAVPIPKIPDEKSLGSRIFLAYALAYNDRWKKPPVRNASTNAIAKRIGERLGEDAIDVARFYVFHNKAFYISNCHALKFFLNDAEALHTQWALDKQVTYTEARAAENRQQNVNAWSRHLTPEGENNGDKK